MTKKPTAQTALLKPVFDKDVPIPKKGKAEFLDPKHAYLVGQESFGISYALSVMEVGDSCLLSNWATTSVTYIQNKTGFRFQREIQDDGTVRIWRVE